MTEYETDPRDEVDYCIYCFQSLPECECGVPTELEAMQGQEEHDEIDAGIYD